MSETLTLFESDVDLVAAYIAEHPTPTIDWRTRACLGHPTDLWFPETNHRKAPDTDPAWRAPRRICQSCPERVACMAYSVVVIRTTAIDGMFGGRTPNERRELLDELLRRRVIS